jgi:uncharacterized membrane-anchored protein
VGIFEDASVYQAVAAAAIVSVVVLVSTFLFWLINNSVLEPSRFHHKSESAKRPGAAKGLEQSLLGNGDTGTLMGA